MREVFVRDLGRLGYDEALLIQKDLVEKRKQGLIPDQLLIVEHPHVIAFHHTDRGGDITYHGPGQIVGYPIFDLREWKRDVVAYVRAVEQAIMDALAEFGVEAMRVAGCTGVWVNGKKVAAIGVHISRWVTSHGFALNHTTDLSYFQYIVPCGITKPVTSMRELGSAADRDAVTAALTRGFAKNFQFELLGLNQLTETFS
jgi:lipoyl(octanoyl) transferase